MQAHSTATAFLGAGPDIARLQRAEGPGQSRGAQPAVPVLLLCAASAQVGSLLTHYGNAVGPALFGAGCMDKVTWWKVGHIVAYLTLIVHFIVGLAWWRVLGLW